MTTGIFAKQNHFYKQWIKFMHDDVRQTVTKLDSTLFPVYQVNTSKPTRFCDDCESNTDCVCVRA
jgi:hypothetical protein